MLLNVTQKKGKMSHLQERRVGLGVNMFDDLVWL